MSVSEQSTRQARRHQESPLKSERGSTTIQDGVVSKVAGVAAQEVDGVRMGGSTSQSADSLLGSITGGSSGGSASRGVSVEVGELEAAVDLAMTVEYGRSIHQIAEAVRNNVIRRVEDLVGLRVAEVNISVEDVFFAHQEQ
jgi:uncharacterized alkaline shock family protein YloU